MKSLILAGAVVLATASLSQAQVIVSDDFTYSGLLTGNGWANHSGSGTFVSSNGSFPTLSHGGGSREDVNLAFGSAQGAADTTYASFDMNVATADLSLLDSSGLYCAHFRVGFDFSGRTGVLSPASGGDWALAINGDSSNLGGGASWPTDLDFDTIYKIVISWNREPSLTVVSV